MKDLEQNLSFRTKFDQQTTSAKKWFEKNRYRRSWIAAAIAGYLAVPTITVAGEFQQSLTEYAMNKEIDTFAQLIGPQIGTLIYLNNFNRADASVFPVGVIPPVSKDGAVRDGLVGLGITRDPESHEYNALEGLAYVDELPVTSEVYDSRHKILVNDWVSFIKDTANGSWHVERRKSDPDTGEATELHFATHPKSSELPLTRETIKEAEETIIVTLNLAQTRKPIKLSN